MSTDFHAIRYHEYGPADRLVLDVVSRPALVADQILVQVMYAGVNPVDWKLRSGAYKAFMPVELPVIPGIDFSGLVAETGPGVRHLKKGEAVFGIADGSYAEFAVAKAHDVVPLPPGLSFEMAAAVPVGALTAWKALEDAQVRAGQTVVILGAAGGVGQFAVQLAHLKGAKVVGTASRANFDFVTELGADTVVDYASGAVESALRGADAILDLVGGAALEGAYALVKKGGFLVTIAGSPSDEKAEQFGIQALRSGRGPAELLGPISDLLARKAIKVEVGKIFPLEEARAAHELSQLGHGRGKILLKVK
ncbi:MAG TPA: NADP-dependent oxidoreductase [Rectinemataceae bacterium]|nr:NADP-dependent oxidoreductase [Rectinemataceae bacterium]